MIAFEDFPNGYGNLALDGAAAHRFNRLTVGWTAAAIILQGVYLAAVVSAINYGIQSALPPGEPPKAIFCGADAEVGRP